MYAWKLNELIGQILSSHAVSLIHACKEGIYWRWWVLPPRPLSMISWWFLQLLFAFVSVFVCICPWCLPLTLYSSMSGIGIMVGNISASLCLCMSSIMVGNKSASCLTTPPPKPPQLPPLHQALQYYTIYTIYTYMTIKPDPLEQGLLHLL